MGQQCRILATAIEDHWENCRDNLGFRGRKKHNKRLIINQILKKKEEERKMLQSEH